jgi:predicted nuclease of restriction endonuclease-like (RecB) superfamily
VTIALSNYLVYNLGENNNIKVLNDFLLISGQSFKILTVLSKTRSIDEEGSITL